MKRDDIYSAEKTGTEPFRFDESVTRVFPDMLKRSIPGYAASIEAIGSLAARYVTAGSRAYDLVTRCRDAGHAAGDPRARLPHYWCR